MGFSYHEAICTCGLVHKYWKRICKGKELARETSQLNSKKLDATEVLNWYQRMLTIRKMEDRILQLFKEGKVPASTHLCQGQEAVYTGVCSCLHRDDYALGTYRGHGEAAAKGVPAREILAEIFGKSTGCCKGKGGSMHMSKKEIGLVGTFSVVAAGLPCAVGLGLSCKLRHSDQVVVCFFGDGATNNGAFHESLNMASLWSAPVVFVCVNNLYAEYTPLSKSTRIKNLADRAKSYEMAGIICDGNDFFEVRKATQAAVVRARKGEGPTLIECKTYRHGGHSRLDDGSTYRSREEVDQWLKRDPIIILREKLLQSRTLSEEQDRMIVANADKIVEDAVTYALSSPEPPLSSAFEGVSC